MAIKRGSFSVGSGPDPELTLSGDASGSVEFTDLGDATLSVTVADDSHTHDTRYYTETEADTLLSGKSDSSHSHSSFSGDVAFDTSTLYVDSTNNYVGIGTTSPSERLNVIGDIRIGKVDDSYLIFEDTVTPSESFIKHDSVDGSLVLAADQGNDLADSGISMRVDSVTRMRLDSSGNLGIGTTTPGSPLHLFGAGNSVDQIRISSNTGTVSEYGFLGANASTNVMRYGYWTGSGFGNHHFEGNVGINDSTPSHRLDVNGDINTTGQYRIDGVQQAVWTSYTPTLYTYSGSSNTHQTGTGGYLNFTYAVVGDIVYIQAFVRYSTGFANATSCNSTLRPRFSVPSGYPIASNNAQTGSSIYAQTNGWGNLGTYPTPGYNGSVLALNDGSTHSSNGYLQFVVQRPSSTMGSSNGYFYSAGVANSDNPVAAVSYAYIYFTTWYRTA